MKNSTLIKLVVYTCVTILAMFIAFPVYAIEEDRGEFYPLLTVVINKDYSENSPVVLCQDREGNIWSFYDDDDTWEKGDIANLLMWNMGGNIEEDEVIEVYWEGYTENFNLFCKVNGWR